MQPAPPQCPETGQVIHRVRPNHEPRQVATALYEPVPGSRCVRCGSRQRERRTGGVPSCPVEPHGRGCREAMKRAVLSVADDMLSATSTEE